MALESNGEIEIEYSEDKLKNGIKRYACNLMVIICKIFVFRHIQSSYFIFSFASLS